MTKQIVAPARRWRVAVGPVLPAFALAGLLSACGGGDDEAGPASTAIAPASPVAATASCAPPAVVNPRSVVGGTIIGRSDPSFILVTPGDGASYLFYGPDLASTALLSGYIQISGGGSCYSGDPLLYNANEPLKGVNSPASVLLAIDPTAPAVTGSLHYYEQTATYQFGGGAVPGSAYRYDTPASVGDVVGNWTLTDMQGKGASLSVSPDGGISGHYQGCTLTGTLKPTAGGVNQMDLQATLTGCKASGPGTLSLPYNGFAIAFPMDAGGTQLLIFASAYVEWVGLFDAVVAIGRR